MAVSRDLASNGLWVQSLERSLARRGRPRRASLELGMLTPPRDLSDPDNLAESVLYWRTRRAATNSSSIPAAGSATALALLAATTIPALAGGRSDTAKTATGGASRVGAGSTRSHLVAHAPEHKAFDASAVSGLGPVRTIADVTSANTSSASVTYGSIKAVQKMLGVSADGKIGSVTAAAIRHFQASHGLTVNGVVDETTFNAMQAAYAQPAQPEVVTQGGGASAGGLAHVASAAATAPVVASTPAPASVGGTEAATPTAGSTTTTTQIAAATATDATTTPVATAADATTTGATTDPTTTATAPVTTTAPAATSDASATTVGTQPAVTVPEGVSALQTALHVPADGTFGAQTKAAVEAFQSAHGLTPDGVVGPQTRAALGLGDGPTLVDTQPPPPPPATTTTSNDATTGSTSAGGSATTDTSTTTSTGDTTSSSDTTSSPTSSDTSSSDTTSTTTATSGEPSNVATGISEMVDAADQIATLPYIWGGGHGSWVSPGYDCSGSVSYVLHAAGLLSVPEDSSALMSYGAAGPGQYITIYASPTHAWMTIDGRRFDTVALQEDGSRWASGGGEFAGFVVRHPVGY
ncbi:MAG: peptidoglycan-binding protein [Solirubrobacteraceae bacterium]